MTKVCDHGTTPPMPAGYVQWHDEAERRAKVGWEQRWCHACAKFAIWVKPKAGPMGRAAVKWVKDTKDNDAGSPEGNAFEAFRAGWRAAMEAK